MPVKQTIIKRYSYIRQRFIDLVLPHLQALFFSLGQLFSVPLGNLMTIIVIGISLALPGVFYIAIKNLQVVSSGWETTLQISVFLNDTADADTAQRLASFLQKNPQVDTVEIVTPAAALIEYRNISGFSEALSVLDDNPFPYLLLVQPTDIHKATNNTSLVTMLQAHTAVASVQHDKQWTNRLYAWLNIAERAVMILSILLGIAVLLVIGNTIRLAIVDRQQEIAIMKLFGATDAFIQRPFLYIGLCYGGLGGLLSCILIAIALQLMAEPVARVADLYNSDFSLSHLSLMGNVNMLLTSAALGLLGSWLSVRQYLRSIEPS